MLKGQKAALQRLYTSCGDQNPRKGRPLYCCILLTAAFAMALALMHSARRSVTTALATLDSVHRKLYKAAACLLLGACSLHLD